MRDERLDNRPTPWQELMLIRAGHHLWREYKSKNAQGWPKETLDLALSSVWAAKEELRVNLRREWLELCENRKNALAKLRSKNASST